MSDDPKNYWTKDFKDANGQLDKGKVLVRVMLVLFCLYMIWFAYYQFGIKAAVSVAVLALLVLPGGIIAKRNKYEKKHNWYIGAFFATLVWLFFLTLFLKSCDRYDPRTVFIYPSGKTGWINLPSNHLKAFSYKKGDLLKIWSRSEFELKAYINPKEAYWDSIQGNKKFSSYIDIASSDFLAEKYKKKNKVLDTSLMAVYPGFNFQTTPYRTTESFQLTFLKDIDSLKIKKHPDSLLASSIYFASQGVMHSDVEAVQTYLGVFLVLGLVGIAALLGQARITPRDDSPEAKAKKKAQKMKGKKSKEKETKDTFHEPQPGTAMARTEVNSQVPARADDALSTTRNMIMSIVADIEKIQASQSALTNYSDSFIGVQWSIHKDQLLKRVKEAKIADIALANRLLQELISLRDKTRAFYTSDMKDQEEVIRRKIEIAKLDAELYKLLPKGEEENKKEAVKIRYTPLLRKHQLEAEAERLMFIKNSAKQYENDIKDMLQKAGAETEEGNAEEQELKQAKNEWEEYGKRYKITLDGIKNSALALGDWKRNSDLEAYQKFHNKEISEEELNERLKLNQEIYNREMAKHKNK